VSFLPFCHRHDTLFIRRQIDLDWNDRGWFKRTKLSIRNQRLSKELREQYGLIAVVLGRVEGAGKGIAIALGEAGATVMSPDAAGGQRSLYGGQ